MGQEQFSNLVEERLNKIKEIILIKGKEYIRNDNPLHVFKEGSKITGLSTTDVLDGMLLKHYISYRDMLKDLNDNKPIKESLIKEKFGDILVYFIIQEIQFLEYSTTEVKEDNI